MTKNDLRLFLVAPLAAALFACDAEDTQLASQSDDLGTTGVDAGSTQADAGPEGPACLSPQLRDCALGQAAAIIHTANKGEIELSKSLRDRLTDPAVQKPTARLIEEHSKANEELEALLDEHDITPTPNANTKALTEATKLTLESLSKKSGSELDASFVTNQLLKHAQVLGTIDHVLLPSVEGSPLEAYLKKTRKDVAGHTKEIAETQAKLVGKCGGDAGQHADGGAGPTVVPHDSVDAGLRH
jgi:predicted outer membrane protein